MGVGLMMGKVAHVGHMMDTRMDGAFITMWHTVPHASCVTQSVPTSSMDKVAVPKCGSTWHRVPSLLIQIN